MVCAAFFITEKETFCHTTYLQLPKRVEPLMLTRFEPLIQARIIGVLKTTRVEPVLVTRIEPVQTTRIEPIIQEKYPWFFNIRVFNDRDNNK